MTQALKRLLKRILRYARNQAAGETALINQGKILSALYKGKDAETLADFEWKVFSQWGEDGIIDFLVSEIPIENKTFIEFGVEDFSESNCRFLLMNQNWQGFVIDGSEDNIKILKQAHYFWKYDLQALAAFIDKDNINSLLQKSGFKKDLGILSVDIDGNDYHVLKAITTFDPRIIICECNLLFGVKRKISALYDPKFNRTEKHYSNLYFGASIAAMSHLLQKRGYSLVGTGKLGPNAYFVKTSLMNQKLQKLSKNPFNFAFNFRESKDKQGNVNLLRGDDRYKEVKGMKVLNVESGKIEDL